MRHIVASRFEIILFLFFFLISSWFMNKSFGYNSSSHQIRIARHEVGDFGLHLSLIRSFSWGNNSYLSAESPFYPGQKLPYHYYFDLFIGLLEKVGLRLDTAFNGVSALCFAGILFLIYKISQEIFGQNKLIGILSSILFLFHSSFTFVDFFKNQTFASILHNLRYMPDYIHKGPFDGSVISIFFTLNVFLNQRHLIAALAIQLLIVYILLKALNKKKLLSVATLILMSIALGISSRIHTLAFLSTMVFVFFVGFISRQYKTLFILLLPAGLIFLIFSKGFLVQDVSHPFINPGFLAAKPLTISTFLQFWILNLGVAFFLIPLGIWKANEKQKKIFLSIFVLFVIGNIFQFSFRIDHNHSLFNYFIIFANMYVAYFLIYLWKKGHIQKMIVVFLLALLTVSGVIDILPIKNDFQLTLNDAPRNTFMQWIKMNTQKDAVFLEKQDLLDPVTLSGRRNYLGDEYYLTVMGYDYARRKTLVAKFFEIHDRDTISIMKKEKIGYIVIPKKQVNDFPYHVNNDFLLKTLPVVYHDDEVEVFKL